MTTQTQTEALKLVLETLEDYVDEYGPWSDDSGAQYVLRVGKEALAQQAVVEQDLAAAYRTELDKLSQRNYELRMENAQLKAQPKEPEQEPVAIPDCGEAGHADGACGNRECLPIFRRNTTPPQRTWVGLTDEEMYRYCPIWLGQADFKALMLHIESKLKDKNTRGQE